MIRIIIATLPHHFVSTCGILRCFWIIRDWLYWHGYCWRRCWVCYWVWLRIQILWIVRRSKGKSDEELWANGWKARRVSEGQVRKRRERKGRKWKKPSNLMSSLDQRAITIHTSLFRHTSNFRKFSHFQSRVSANIELHYPNYSICALSAGKLNASWLTTFRDVCTTCGLSIPRLLCG